jgi:hypothetical protein
VLPNNDLLLTTAIRSERHQHPKCAHRRVCLQGVLEKLFGEVRVIVLLYVNHFLDQ